MTFRQWLNKHEQTIDNIVTICIGIMALAWVAFMIVWVAT